jgi:hypothetical protein
MRQLILAGVAMLLGGSPPDTCSGRYTGPFGSYVNGPVMLVRVFDGLEGVETADHISVEGCFSSIWGWRYENTAPLGFGWFLYSLLQTRVFIQVNGTNVMIPLLPNDDVGEGEEDNPTIPPFDGNDDWTGPSGRIGLTEPRGTFISFDIPLTSANRAAFASDFPVGVTGLGSSSEAISGGSHGQTDFFWRGGMSFAVVQ